MQSNPKPQFANWLIQQVETGQYTGLCYVGPNKFRVPWKHNSRKDCKDEDSKIFRAWAVASGKISEFPTDKARWKTNFRCALNNLSVRFKMIQDNSKISDDPHKVYEIINTEYNYEGLPEQVSKSDSVTPDIYSSPTEYFPQGNEQYQLVDTFTGLDLGKNLSGEQPWGENYNQPNADGIGSFPIAAQDHPQVLPEQMPYIEEEPPQVLNSPPQPSIYDIEISIHYRKKEMLKATLSAQYLQLYYHHEAPDLNAHHLCFPSTDGLLDQKQIEFTNRILNSIQRGLLLEVRETGIYACRQDKCHVFASTNDPNVAEPDPKKLPKNAMVELLSFEKYIHDLRKFKENNGGSPQYTINMCFGERFPDGKPLERKLIMVTVVPLICRHFHEMAQIEGASSLHSDNVSLQISHNSLYDLIYSVFGLPTIEEPGRAAAPFLQLTH
ncbi:interferon regulatory factor 7 [Echeneis naucrates]|uniref:IRF tryptophan pentad repeat domain-containing protein n=1 Tax=Echeneis naucrates TaxID=173247 RepID=A0A665UQG7_ECHNA|nr:interferon regulatory factor 7 [Echeneis naucrates]